MNFDVIPQLAFPNLDVYDACKKTSELGFKYIELRTLKEVDEYRLKETLDKYKLTAISMGTPYQNVTEERTHENWLKGIEKACKTAKLLGVKKIITHGGQETGEELNVLHERVVNLFSSAIPILEKYDITLIIEPMNKILNPGKWFVCSTKRAFNIVRDINNPHVKLVFDIFHMQIMEGNIVNTITQNMDCIDHFHASGVPNKNELQFGELNYSYIFSQIEKTGYTGFCGMEYEPELDPVESLMLLKKLYPGNY